MKSNTSLSIVEKSNKQRPDMFMMYLEAFAKVLKRVIDSDQTIQTAKLSDRKQIVLYGVKMMNLHEDKKQDSEQLIKKLNQMEFVKAAMSTLSPDELENIFPIEKTYDGKRYGIKDYLFVRKELDKIGRDIKIGDRLERLLWDFMNPDLRTFNVINLSIFSDIRRSQGQKGIMEEFMEEKGIYGYTLLEGEGRKKYLKDNKTGEITEVRKKTPRYLNLVK
ncbi:hypothetical protein [Paenibacillus sp. HJGM_3]|uniref:hypothetical protein n=1 Tax=Paenibacillus sp. HJGM_3 TaxID=3379816 RepID=UPI00385FEE9D